MCAGFAKNILTDIHASLNDRLTEFVYLSESEVDPSIK